jgi:hypothetical protein
MRDMREKLIQNISRMQSRITDLQDMVDDGMPYDVKCKTVAKIEMLQDMIFSDSEYLENLKDSA